MTQKPKKGSKVVPLRKPAVPAKLTESEKALLALVPAPLTAEANRKIGEDLVATGLFKWAFKDDKVQNLSAVQAVSDLVRLVVEPADNCNDTRIRLAVQRATRDGFTPKSVVEAVDRLFHIPEGRSELLSRAEFDEVSSDVFVAVLDGSFPGTEETLPNGTKRTLAVFPNIAFRDHGTGLRPDDIRKKILTSSAGDKIQDLCSSGAFGTGASLVQSACDGSCIMSRLQPDLRNPGEADRVGITLCMKRSDPAFKLSAYYVLVDAKTGEVPSLPAAVVREWAFRAVCTEMQDIGRARGNAYTFFKREMPPEEQKQWKGPHDFATQAAVAQAKSLGRPTDFDSRWYPFGGRPDAAHDTEAFDPGTLSVYYNFRIGPYKRHIWDQRANLRTLLEVALGDLRLPFRLYDLMTESASSYYMRRLKIVRGMRSRLAGNVMLPEGHAKRTVEHAVERLPVHVTIPLPGGGTVGETVHVSYYVTKKAPRKNWGWERRESYAPPGYSVLFTVEGRTAHFEGPDFFRRSGGPDLGILRNHLLVVVQLDAMTPEWKHTILQSTRERLIGGPVQAALFQGVLRALAADETLKEIDTRRRLEALMTGGEHTACHNDAGIRYLLRAARQKGPTAFEQMARPRREPELPLPTRPDGPTFINIDSVLPLQFRPGGRAEIRFASDAPDGVDVEFDILTRGRVAEYRTFFPFVGGRAKTVITVADDAEPTKLADCTLRFRFANGRRFEFECPFNVTEERPSGHDGGSGKPRTESREEFPEIRGVRTTDAAFTANDWDWTKRDRALYRIFSAAPPRIPNPVVVIHTGYGLFERALMDMARIKRLSQKQIDLYRQRFVVDVGSALWVHWITNGREDLSEDVQYAHVLAFLQAAGLVADRKRERVADYTPIGDAVGVPEDSTPLVESDEDAEIDDAPPDAILSAIGDSASGTGA